MPWLPIVPLTKKKASVPTSAGASGAAGEDCPPTKAVDPVVKTEPAVVLLKNIAPASPLPPPEAAAIVTCPFVADVKVTLSPATR